MRLLACLIIASFCCTCSNELPSSSNQSQMESIATPAQFPSVGDLDIERETLSLESSALLLENNGADFRSTLHQNISAQENQCVFSPNWVKGSSEINQTAFATYRFVMETYSGAASLQTFWSDEPESYQDVWIGLANWQSGRWVWFNAGSEGKVDIAQSLFDDCIHAESDIMIIAVLVTGTTVCSLRNILIGDYNDGEWAQFGNDSQHTRRSPYLGAQSNQVQWEYDTGSEVYTSPARGPDGTIYFGGWDGKVHALHPDGNPLAGQWPVSFEDQFWSSPAVDADGTIYIGSTGEAPRLIALNPNGSQKWEFEVDGTIYSSPVIGNDGTVYFGCNDYKLYALNKDGDKLWDFSTMGQIQSSPAISPDGVVYVGSYDNNLYAIKPDGEESWHFATNDVIFSSPAVASDGTVYFGCHDNRLYAINPDGTKKWEFATGSSIISSPAIGIDGFVYVGSFDGKLYCVDPLGQLDWDYQTGGAIWASPTIGSDGSVYIGDAVNTLFSLGRDGTLNWQFSAGNAVDSSVMIAGNGSMYVGSHDGKLYRLGEMNQDSDNE